MERSLVLLKPDALQRSLAGKIISRLEARGLRIVGLKMMWMDMDLARSHYEAHVDKPFFRGLSEFMTSRPIIAIAVEGKNAVDIVRHSMGSTDPQKADPGTIRGEWGTDIGRNLVHGSDSTDSANRELSIFFQDNEIFEYEREIDRWVTEA